MIEACFFRMQHKNNIGFGWSKRGEGLSLQIKSIFFQELHYGAQSLQSGGGLCAKSCILIWTRFLPR